MSTAQLTATHLGSIAKSIKNHALRGRTAKSCDALGAAFCRALGLSPFAEECEDALVVAEIDTLVATIAKCNAEAVSLRYGATAAPPPRWGFLESIRGRALNEPALLKALRCAAYNCDNVDLPPAFAAICDALQDSIIDANKDYQDAKWFL